MRMIGCMGRASRRAFDGDLPPSGTDGVLTAEEVASLLQVTPAWVYAETRQRRIPHMRLGRYVRYRRSALLEWMEDMERSTGGSPVRARRSSPDRRLSHPRLGV
jgi:excisionase family DNA binding protein